VILLRWSWTVRFATYATARLASQPVLVLPPLLGGAVVAVIERRCGFVVCSVLFVLTVVLASVMLLAVLRRQVRRQLSAARAEVQEYALSAAALDVGFGRDRHSLPLSELYVVGSGRSWLTLRRRGLGRNPLILFFDDPALVPAAAAIVDQHGASQHL
jgi:hypothetical protein